ncbi:MAG TPA: hypothetical protein DCW90_01240 [Lachnospiraceae bacterium]|nr:hypothetical protein [Lachnospiraceae bacterium]
MKIYELARELEVKSKVLVDLMNENNDDKKYVATSVLTEDQVDFLNLEVEDIKEEEEKKNNVKTDADYRPDEMIPCHSIFPGVVHFNGIHSGMTYKFVGSGDRRNVEYQDLKAGMLEGYPSLFNPDIIIEDDNLLNDEHWSDIKDVYANMFDANDIQKLMNLSVSDFKTAFTQVPTIVQKIIIEKYATQIENGTFNDLSKAKIIDEVCGTRFDLKY